MKKSLSLAILATLIVLAPLAAQDQSGSVAIAENIRAADEGAIFVDFPGCVSGLVKSGTKEKDARKDCKEIFKIASETTKRVANEAADATKASRPVVVGYDGYGYGYGYNRSYSYGYGYSRPVVRRTVEAPAPRPAPLPRQPPPPRTPPPARRTPVR